MKLINSLKSTKAAIDLASIMVGVLVIGIIGGIIAATVFSVIPWAQDNAAKASLGSVNTAQSAFAGQNGGKYATFDGLVQAEMLPGTDKLDVVSPDGTCYVALSRSDTGRIYYNTNQDPTPREYVAGTTTTPCADVTDIATGGPVDTATPGWTVANQNNNQVFTGLASSASGAVLAVPAQITFPSNQPAVVKVSRDFGSTFTDYVVAPGVTQVQGIAISGSGQDMLVYGSSTASERVYVSNNYGQTWTSTETRGMPFPRQWTSASVSQNGDFMTVVGPGNQLYISQDSGASWTMMAVPSWYFQRAQITDSGVIIASSNAIASGYPMKSTDRGVTWTPLNSLPNNSRWNSVTTNADGSKIVALPYNISGSGNTQPYVSVNGGTTWTRANVPDDSYGYYTGLINAVGDKIVLQSPSLAVVYISSNDGASFTTFSGSSVTSYFSYTAMNRDASKIAAVAYNRVVRGIR